MNDTMPEQARAAWPRNSDGRTQVTIRDLLARQVRRFMVLGFCLWLAFAAIAVASSAHYVPAWLVVIPFIGFFATVLATLYRIRCPRCGGRLGQMAGYLRAKPGFLVRPMNYCPYCGVNLDESVAASPNHSRSGGDG